MMTAEQLSAYLDQPLWKIEAALKRLQEKGLVNLSTKNKAA